MQGSADGAGNVTIQASTMNQSGLEGATSNGTTSATVNSNGRVQVGSNYLYLYGTNQAAYLDASNSGGQNVGLGWMEAQSATTPETTPTECSAPMPSPPVQGNCDTASLPYPYFTGSLPLFDATMSSNSGMLTLDGSGNINLTEDSAGQGLAWLDNILSGLLVTDWTAAGWPSQTNGTFQIDQAGNAQMYCAVVSAGTDQTGTGYPNGRVICANVPGGSIDVTSAGRPSITVLQQ